MRLGKKIGKAEEDEEEEEQEEEIINEDLIADSIAVQFADSVLDVRKRRDRLASTKQISLKKTTNAILYIYNTVAPQK